MKKLVGSLLLFITTIIWGLAFTAQSTAAESIGSFTFNTARCILAAFFLLIVLLCRKGFHAARKKKANEHKPLPKKKLLLGGILCGVTLFIGMNFQQFGIAAYPPEAATSGRAGFLTATYVVMIPIVQRLRGKKLQWPVIAAVIGCIIGMYLLCMSGGFEGIYTGDILVFGCALGYTAYILAVDRCSQLDGLIVSCIQFIVCGTICAVGMLLTEKPDMTVLLNAAVPILYTGILSSGVGYTLQILGQKTAEPAVASVIMSLESVFAAVFGWLILGEILSARELAGCGLVFLSVLLAQIPDFIRMNQKEGK